MIKIVKAEYIEDYRLSLTFVNENFQSEVKNIIKKEVDLENYLKSKKT
jgi:hypothetical protein